MTAEESVSAFLDKKYGTGGKELGDWTPTDVVEFAEFYLTQKVEALANKIDSEDRSINTDLFNAF